MTTSRFEHDTAVTPIGEQRYRATVDDGWFVIDGAAPNGGYLMAIGARAMADCAGFPDPITVTAHFLAPPQPGPVEISTELIRKGGRHATVAARVLQDGREMTRLLATFGDLGQASGPTVVDLPPPDLPERSTCLDTGQAAMAAHQQGRLPAPPPILLRFDHRQPAEYVGWSVGKPAGRGINGGWIRWPDAESVDVFGLLVVADCYPPAVFNLGEPIPVGWAPTIELTVHVRGRPQAGWLATQMTTRAVTDGYFEEDGVIFDSAQRLVALSRQSALLARPPRNS